MYFVLYLSYQPRVDPTKLFFFLTKNFSDKLGHFIADAFFLFVTNTQTYQRKSENEEKQSLVGLTPGWYDK